MTTKPTAELRVTAFLPGPDRPDIRNAIHSTEGARDYGYQAALVGGVTVFGWSTPLILEVLGTSWLDHGWADLTFRRPTYPGDELVITLEEDGSVARLKITGLDGHDRVEGELGLGDAPWLDQVLLKTPFQEPEPELQHHPLLTPEVAPVGRRLSPLGFTVTVEEAREYAEKRARTNDPLFTGPRPRLHPGWIAGRPPGVLHHSYDYGPAIHARSHLQIIAPAFAGQDFVATATFRESYERKGHHYGAYDCTIYAADGTELWRQRHTTIYQVAKRENAG
ncbi:MAG TPA: hypothetical protein VNN10_06155 [Dehalococcoidia bacterium]|nr:hypothetical protein [Dehalococcoidia bacterium]